MMEITKNLILEKIYNGDDVDNIITLRLYESYLENIEQIEKKQKEKLTAVDILVAYENIQQKLNKSIDQLSSELYSCIQENYILLENYMNNFSFSDKQKVNATIKCIICLESLLGLRISFPIPAYELLKQGLKKMEYAAKKTK